MELSDGTEEGETEGKVDADGLGDFEGADVIAEGRPDIDGGKEVDGLILGKLDGKINDDGCGWAVHVDPIE